MGSVTFWLSSLHHNRSLQHLDHCRRCSDPSVRHSPSISLPHQQDSVTLDLQLERISSSLCVKMKMRVVLFDGWETEKWNLMKIKFSCLFGADWIHLLLLLNPGESRAAAAQVRLPQVRRLQKPDLLFYV